jgi:hypothetical protein
MRSVRTREQQHKYENQGDVRAMRLTAFRNAMKNEPTPAYPRR